MSSLWEAVPEDSPSTASTAASESSEISEAVGPPGYRLSVARGVGRGMVGEEWGGGPCMWVLRRLECYL